MWGAGCIFIEMLNGYPCFPGVRDIYDQLDKIFRVVGTPTEDTWPGVSRLPNYRPHKLCYYKPILQLGHVWPRLFDIAFAEHLATAMLQPRAGKRVSADQALRHRYFSDLPSSLHHLPAEQSIYSVPGISFMHDHDRLVLGHLGHPSEKIIAMQLQLPFWSRTLQRQFEQWIFSCWFPADLIANILVLRGAQWWAEINFLSRPYPEKSRLVRDRWIYCWYYLGDQEQG